MTPLRRFEIHQPATTREASEMLTQYGDEAGVYAGGTELLLAMKHEALSYRHLVDVKTIPGLNSIAQSNGDVEIGAAATHRAIERSPLVREKLPVLADLESRVANVRVRATGTLGGNLCFAEPHSDPATLLLILGGAVRIEGSAGVRELPVGEFIAGPYTNALAPGEILTGVRIPSAKPNQRIAYLKFQVHERPTLGLGLRLETPDNGRTFSSARVAIGCLCPSPTRVPQAEELLTGVRAEVERHLPDAAALIADIADLTDDQEGSADYKRNLIRVFLGRAFRKALGEDSS